MACFWHLTLTLIMSLTLSLTSPTLCSHISLSPAEAPNVVNALPPDYQPLSPETTPLFPSPVSSGGLPPTESSMPTIPATLSPPNPDAVNDPAAFSPASDDSSSVVGGGKNAAGLSLPNSASRAPGDYVVVDKLIAAGFVAFMASLVA